MVANSDTLMVGYEERHLMKKIAAVWIWIFLCGAAPARASELSEFLAASPTPPLTLADLGGNTYTLADFRGQVVLVNFWASWCAPCIIEMPGMQRLKQAMTGRPFSILAVNVKESKGTIWKFLNRVKVDFTLLRDSDGRVARDWQVNVYPASYLVDPAGEIRYVAYGPRQWDNPEIVQLIEEMLNEDNLP